MGRCLIPGEISSCYLTATFSAVSSYNHSFSVQRDKERREEKESEEGRQEDRKGRKNCLFAVSLFQGTNPIGLGSHLYDLI